MGACVLCEEQITTPLGPQRLGEQIATWLNETNEAKLDGFRKASSELLGYKQMKEDHCIVTNSPIHVCAFCYTEHIFKWFLSTNPSREEVRAFLIHFDYDTSKYGLFIRPEKQARI